ncbi:hypothetical protein SAVIM338S_00870 [Streptomyces avidinii]
MIACGARTTLDPPLLENPRYRVPSLGTGVHRSRLPLGAAPIDHVTRAQRAAAELDELENGAVNGYSPWACRNAEDAAQDDFELTA